MPGLGASALALLQSPQPPPIETILTTLLNTLSARSTDVVLLLDDYHLIDAPPIHQALAFLLDHLPPQLHLVIASRADPPLPVSRLRARGELTELRAADLRFTPEEAAAFLTEVMQLPLPARRWQRSKRAPRAGSPACNSPRSPCAIAPIMPASSLPLPAATALWSTTWPRKCFGTLPEQLQTLLTPHVHSGPPVWPAVRCRCCGDETAVARITASQVLLEELERANLFIVPLDDTRQWYRYHHLFADVLRGRLREQHAGNARSTPCTAAPAPGLSSKASWRKRCSMRLRPTMGSRRHA